MKRNQHRDTEVELTKINSPLHAKEVEINLIDVVRERSPDGPEKENQAKVHLDYFIETMPGHYFAISVALLGVFIVIPALFELTDYGVILDDNHAQPALAIRIAISTLITFGTMWWCYAVHKKLRHMHPIILMLLIGQVLLEDPWTAIALEEKGHFSNKVKVQGSINLPQSFGVSLQTLAIMLIVDKCRYPEAYKPIGAKIYNSYSNSQTFMYWVGRLSWDRWAAYICTSSWAVGYFKALRECSKTFLGECHLFAQGEAQRHRYITYCCVCGVYLCTSAYFVYVVYQAYRVLEKKPYLTNRYANLVIRIFLAPCVIGLVIVIESVNFFWIYVSTLYLPIFFAITHLPPRKVDAQNLVDILKTKKESSELHRESMVNRATRATRMLQRETESDSHAIDRPVFILEDAQWALNFSTLVYKDYDYEKDLTNKKAGVLADEADVENGGLSEEKNTICSHRELLDRTGAKYIKHIAIKRSNIAKLENRTTFASRVGAGGASTTSLSDVDEEDAVYLILYLVGTTLWVSFRGTVNATQAQMDVAMRQVPIEVKSLSDEANDANHHDHHGDHDHDHHHHHHHAHVVYIHDGFWTGYSAVRTDMFEAIDKAMKESGDIKTVTFTGHSLGGAIATIASTDFELVMHDRQILMDMDHEDHREKLSGMTFAPVAVELYTLGSPRPGDYAFFSLHQSHITNSFRIVNEGDVIPGTPRSDCGTWKLSRFCNLFPTASCPQLILRALNVHEYKHVGHSVYLSNKIKGDIVVQPNVVEGFVYLRWSRDMFSHQIDRYRVALQIAPQKCQNRVVKQKPNGDVQIVFS